MRRPGEENQRYPQQSPVNPRRGRRRKRKPLRISKKRSAFLFAAIIIATVAVAGVFLRSPDSVSLFNVSATTEPVLPDEILRRYFSYIESGRFEQMYSLLDSVSRERISQEDFIERNRNIYEGIGARNITVTINGTETLPERPGRKFVLYTLQMNTVAGEISHNGRAVFELSSGNEYRLNWTSGLIFPELGESDRVRVRVLPAERGRILDRNGEMLAGPGTAAAVGFVPGRMRREEVPDDEVETGISGDSELYETGDNVPETAFIYNEEDLAKVAELLDVTPEFIMRRLNASYVRDDVFVQLRMIPGDAQELINELLTVQGILINTAHVRYYPLGRSAAHLVGYIQNINAEEFEALRDYGYHMNSVIGRAGLERIYEDVLRAADGREIFIIDSEGNRTTTLAMLPAENGSDIRLTIDADIQRQLYEIFAEDKSASVATNPLTGEVLALVSSPSYDPNDFVRGMTTGMWTALNEDENLPLFNRFRATFSPGSTMKAVTAAIGVDGGYFHPDEDFGRSGLRWQLNESWGRFFVTTVREYNEPANLNNAMAWSDNIYFAKATLRIGAESFAGGLRGLGFGERIPFEYGMFSSIVSRSGEFSSDIQLADSGYGQGEILMNPVHLAVIYGAFVTGGNILEPRLVLENPYPGRTGEPPAEQSVGSPQIWIQGAFSPETAGVVLKSLIFAVDYGTGRNARIPGTVLAGKTGTAELKDAQGDEDGRELGWFVLLTADENAENPLLVVSMVEDVQGRGGSGYVVPRVRQIFERR
ncbi:MAG: penicillin-binding transpeptidase domain-containing protein [Defluviitaleaceae bacterium]|nr:penicillin-binding transpeptidase domain-containing protein [Defluviitaleaceae bacterium]